MKNSYSQIHINNPSKLPFHCKPFHVFLKINNKLFVCVHPSILPKNNDTAHSWANKRAMPNFAIICVVYLFN